MRNCADHMAEPHYLVRREPQLRAAQVAADRPWLEFATALLQTAGAALALGAVPARRRGRD